MPLFADRYELGPVIGQGGMAEVRAALDTRLDRQVAVKVMRPEVAHQPLVRERFESEARLAARLSHPNVVSVYDSGEWEGLPFIVMERLPGDTLHDRMAHGPMAEPEVRQVALEVLSALQTAHAAGVLHRDIKPANILSAGPGHWKVADFGIAKAKESGGGDATTAGLVLGTPAYVAPERLLGAPASVASDLYGLGVVLYEGLGGRRPYDTGSSEGWPGSVAGAPLVPLADVRPGVDPVLASVVERSLARDPAARYASAAEMAGVLGGPEAVIPGAGDATTVMGAGAPATTVMGRTGPATEVLGAAAAGAAVRRPGGPGRGVVAAEEYRRPPPERRPTAGIALAVLAGLAVAAAIIIAVVAAHHGTSKSPATTAPSTSTSSSSTTSTTASTTTTTLATTTTSTTAPPTTTTTIPTTTTTATTSTTLAPSTTVTLTVPGT